MNASERTVRDLLSIAEIGVNGQNSWDIQVHNPAFYDRLLSDGTLGLGESYMDEDWRMEEGDPTRLELLAHLVPTRAPFVYTAS